MIKSITLAALLHDIGKFVQRSKDPLSRSGDLYKKNEKLITLICPENAEGHLSHYHAFWSYIFFNEFESKFQDLTKNLKYEEDFFGESFDNLINLAIYHHNPHSEMQALIRLADWWSSGLDRRKDNSTTRSSKDHSNFRKTPLESIFQDISFSNTQSNLNSTNEQSRFAYPLEALSLTKNHIFPYQLAKNQRQDLKEDYAKLYENFTNDFKKIPTNNFRAFTETLDHLLKKYTWCIPSSTRDKANVSLYDHLKTTAGIATCLYKYKEEFPEAFHYYDANHQLSIQENHYPVLLTCVDLSGIQSFIYNIHSKKAAVALKGRSYYLHLLLDAILRKIYLHKDINLSRLQTIYSSGGKAYLFLPNTSIVIKALQEIKIQLQEELWSHHQLSLYACIGWTPFRYHQEKEVNTKGRKFTNKIVTCHEEEISMAELWKRTSEAAAKEKSRRYYDLLLTEKGFKSFFGDNHKGIELAYTKAYDATDGLPIYEDDPESIDNNKETEEIAYISKSTKQLIDLGRVLKDADFNFSFTKKHSFEQRTYDQNSRLTLRPLGSQMAYHLFDDLNLIEDDTEFRKINSSSDVHCEMINRTDIMTFALKGNNASYGFTFYGGNKQPQILGEKSNYRLKTFEELAIDDQGEPDKLGILRMDVDNLGKIFIQGLNDDLKSFSAYATLSNLLDLFFSGYLNTLRDKEEFKDWISILYSGGDDVFAIGRWDKIIDFALLVRTEFKNFTCNNAVIDLSAGIIRSHAKFPISKGASYAGEAEKKAKNFTRMVQGQNINRSAITLFDQPIGWEEWAEVQKYHTQLKDLINRKNSGKSILHRLQQTKVIKDQQNDAVNYPQVEKDYSYIWQLLYFMKRYQNSDNQDIIKEISKAILSEGQDRRIDLYAIAARWIELTK